MRSESFIYRHMADLLPGMTVVVVSDEAPESVGHSHRFPFFSLNKTHKGWRWVVRGGLYFLA